MLILNTYMICISGTLILFALADLSVYILGCGDIFRFKDKQMLKKSQMNSMKRILISLIPLLLIENLSSKVTNKVIFFIFQVNYLCISIYNIVLLEAFIILSYFLLSIRLKVWINEKFNK